jgi:O-antigen/teichoic acid export membrane protein
MSTLTFLAANIYITNKLLPELKFKTRYFSLNKIKELFFSGIWNSFNRLSSIFSTGLDLVIANLFVSSAAMGSLYLSKTIPGLVLSVFAMIATSFAPQFTISYARNEMDSVKDQLIFSMKILGMIASIPVAILFIFGDVFYSLWIPGEDIKLIYLLSIVSCIEYVFVLPLEGLWNIFTVTNKVKQSSLYLFINSVIVILIVFMLMHVLESDILKLFVIAGVSTIFSIIRGLLFLPIYGAKCLGMKWNTFYPMIFKSTLSTILLFCFSGIIKYFFYNISWVALVIYCILIVIISLCINAVIVLDREDRKIVITTMIKKIRKRREIYE